MEQRYSPSTTDDEGVVARSVLTGGISPASIVIAHNSVLPYPWVSGIVYFKYGQISAGLCFGQFSVSLVALAWVFWSNIIQIWFFAHPFFLRCKPLSSSSWQDRFLCRSSLHLPRLPRSKPYFSKDWCEPKGEVVASKVLCCGFQNGSVSRRLLRSDAGFW